MNNLIRGGNFTSSGICALMCDTKAYNTYILETNMERMLGQSLDGDAGGTATRWGNLVEPRVHYLLPLSYTYSSQVTDVHPKYPFWVGSKDGTNEAGIRAVHDIKCPYTLKSFVQLVLPLYFGFTGLDAILKVRDGFEHEGFKYPPHTDGKKYYWQLVSNACINGTTVGELIVYMPYQSELLEIHEMAQGNPANNWLNYVTKDEIPCLLDGGKFTNLNIHRFDIPQADIDALTTAVETAGKQLITHNITAL